MGHSYNSCCYQGQNTKKKLETSVANVLQRRYLFKVESLITNFYFKLSHENEEAERKELQKMLSQDRPDKEKSLQRPLSGTFFNDFTTRCFIYAFVFIRHWLMQ